MTRHARPGAGRDDRPERNTERMHMADMLKFTARSQQIQVNARGRNVWKVTEKKTRLKPDETALLLCDVWDNHTQKGAGQRLAAMVPRMNRVVSACRNKGVLIIHAPSDVIDFYADHPARKRVVALKKRKPREKKHDDPAMPFLQEHGTTDTPTIDTWKKSRKKGYPWTREHPGITIRNTDAISADGVEVYSLMKAEGRRRLIIMGVHTNYCILNRTFAIKQMTRWGVPMYLVRDLTDAIYDPANPPYVSHDEGTALVVGYIEKFWCPSLTSDDLLKP